jgi:hypothetical protein
MKSNIVAVGGTIGLVVLVAGLASVFEIRLASAQVDATSSTSATADATTTPPIVDTSTTTPIENSASTTPASEAPSTGSDATTTSKGSHTEAASNLHMTWAAPIEPAPTGLKEVHIIGMKYTDYFADGSTTTAMPGDPTIDSNFDKPDAPIPTHEGMTWVHTTGGWLYDTPSGDLELGDYALQPGGTYIQNAPPFVSSTSTPAQIAPSTPDTTVADASTSSAASPATSDASTSTVIAPSDNSTSTTSSDSTTSPAI